MLAAGSFTLSLSLATAQTTPTGQELSHMAMPVSPKGSATTAPQPQYAITTDMLTWWPPALVVIRARQGTGLLVADQDNKTSLASALNHLHLSNPCFPLALFHL